MWSYLYEPDLKEITNQLRIALKNEQANVTATKKPSGLYDVTIDPGIPGPVNYEYIENILLKKMLADLSKEKAEGMSINIISLDKNQYHIHITNISAKLIGDHFELSFKLRKNFQSMSGRDTLMDKSLRACIQKFIHAEEINPINNDDKSCHAEKILEDLTKHSLREFYPVSQMNKKAERPGLILTGSMGKNISKQQFIKSIDPRSNEILKIFLFRLAKECKISVPDKIKIKKTPTQHYLFTAAIGQANKKKLTNKYFYEDLEDFTKNINYFWDQESLNLEKERNSAGKFQYKIPLHKENAARFLIFCLIFNLLDLKKDHLGLKVRNNEKAKVALANFSLSNFLTEIDSLNKKPAHNFIGQVNNYIMYDVGDSKVKKFLSAIIVHIPEDIFIAQFNKIKEILKKKLAELKANKKIDEYPLSKKLEVYIDFWQENLCSLTNIAEKNILKPIQ